MLSERGRGEADLFLFNGKLMFRRAAQPLTTNINIDILNVVYYKFLYDTE